MISLPKVIVGGYPRSGTSFLCNLVARMGFWPGVYSKLVRANKFNELGYWEYLPIRNIAWGAAEYHIEDGIIYTKPKTIPHEPLEFEDPSIAEKIRDIAEKDDVEVYKDNALPILYKLFPKDSKYIVIRRDREDIYQSILRFERTWHSFEIIQDGAFWGISRANVYDAIDIYRKLEQTMMEDVSCLVVNYEDFDGGFDVQLQLIVEFLGLDMARLDMRRLHNVYRPRKEDESKD